MNRRVYLGDQAINISPSAALGAGGQAIVVKEGNLALKIWHKPDADSVQKVEYLLKHPPKLPDNILVPQRPKPLTETPNGAVIGYAMKLLPPDFREFSVLFNRKLRKVQGIELPTVINLLGLAQEDLIKIHGERLVVGDLSGRNAAFVTSPSPKTFWYDTDAWVINGLPCPVWSEFFVDPNLREPNLVRRDFTRETDWYSFAVIAFWSIFYSHPFHGQHPSIEEVLDKAKQGLWLFDKQITKPSFASPAETISDDLLEYFYKVFGKNERLPLPLKLIKELGVSLVKCPLCDNWYSKQRTSCPNCTKATSLPDFEVISLNPLITTKGQLVFVRYQERTLFAISQQGTNYTLHSKEVTSPPREIQLPSFSPGTRFEIVSNHILIAEVGDQLRLIDLNTNQEITATSSQRYSGNRQLAFKGTAKGLLRLSGRQLLLGEVKHNRLVESELPISINTDQTWFWADPISGNVFGLYRTFNRYQFWLVTAKGRVDLVLPQLQAGETLLDINVRFSAQSVLVLRLIQRNGLQYVLSMIISLTGELQLIREEKLTELRCNPLHGGAYDHGFGWYPTDQGMLEHDIFANSYRLVNKTARAVSQSDSIYHLGGHKHFLIIKDQGVDYLILP